MTAVSIDPRLRARRIEVLRLRGRRRLRALMVVLSLLMLCVSVWWIVKRSPLFDVEAIVVTGAVQTPVSEVVAASNIQIGQPLLEVDTSAAREAIANLPWVADVRSDRSISGKVSFLITERDPVATILTTFGWLVLDREGRVVSLADEAAPDLAILGGLTSAVQPGGWVDDDVLPQLEVAARLPASLAAKLASIKLGGHGLELELASGGLVLIGNTNELDAKFLSTLTMLVRLDLNCLRFVDVRAPSVPVLTRIVGCF